MNWEKHFMMLYESNTDDAEPVRLKCL